MTPDAAPAFAYRYLFIDWANTLSTAHFWEQFRDPQHPHHAMYAHAQATIFASRGGSPWLDAWIHGKRTSEEIIAAVYQHPAFDPDFVLRELQDSCEKMQFVDPAIPAYLQSIRAHGIKVIIATDNMDTFSRWTVPGMRLSTLVDGWLNSADLKCTKTETDVLGQSLFFGPFLRANHIEAKESLLIDDNDAAFGMRIERFGIDYISIEPGTGLKAELERILISLDVTR
jgi:FMN phosphatase YigB (HAD superfamily)